MSETAVVAQPTVSPRQPLQLVKSAGPNAAKSEPTTKFDRVVDLNHPNAAHLRVLDGNQALIATAPGQPMRKKIAICGFASSTRQYIHQVSTDAEWELWGLNQLYRHIPRADRWFDIHHNWLEEVVEGTDHLAWAQQCGMPFYLQAVDPRVPTSVKFPIDLCIDALKADYYTSTIAYMLALAALEIDQRVMADPVVAQWTPASGVNIVEWVRRAYSEYTVAIFGVDQTVGSEYFHERACTEYWIGQLSARDITVAIPPESALCKQMIRYGYQIATDQFIAPDDITKHTGQLRGERDELLKRLYMLEGAMECNERWHQVATLRSRGTKVE